MKQISLFILASVFVACAGKTSKESLGVHDLQIFADSLFQSNVDSAMIAGASVIVQKGDERLVQRNYGFASLELQAPMPENPSFEIGSITKQFTAAAILRLAESGKLSLEDDLSEYLDLNTGGRAVTIHQLLNHTSGIPSYTELPEFWSLSMHSYDRDTMFSVIENHDFLFEPGEQMIYNNSAYFLLGLIIEKQSEMGYEEYLRQEFFDPLGMEHTYYCTNRTPVKGKVYGYAYSESGINQKAYLDHTWPYAAGSLCSTAEDLITWLTALHNGKVFEEDGYAQMVNPRALNDGTPIRYAMGLAHYKDNGNEMIQHGGGINGFLSESRYYPEEDLYVVCLVNTTGPMNPNRFSDLLTWEVIEKKEPASMEMDPGLETYSGTYKGQVRGRKIELELALSEEGLIISEKGDTDSDTVRTYIGNATFMDENDIITFHDDGTATFDQPYGFYTLLKE